MATNRITMRTLAVLTLWAGLAGPASADVKTEDVLARRPVQAGVPITTPTGADLAGCRAEQVNWPKAGNVTPTGVVVKDAQGRTVRQFIDTLGRGSPNIWSFHLNGVEAYREVDGNADGKPDQYRWVGPNGGKWGIDVDQDGAVDNWHNISPAELGQELFQAMLTKNARRVEALLPSENELKSLGLPDAEVAKIRERAAGAVKKAMDTAEALKLTEKARWVSLEAGAPSVTPSDTFGGRDDLIKQRTATALVDMGDGTPAAQFQTGELILIGRGWRLIDGPAPGAAPPVPVDGGGDNHIVIKPELQPLVAELDQIKPPADPANTAAMAKYHVDRATVLEKIVGQTQGSGQEPWLRQVVDAYAAAVEADPKTPAPMGRLNQWKAQVEQVAAKSPVAAYVAFRATAAEYAAKLATSPPADLMKVQEWWRGQLEAFVKAHGASEEAPEAMLRLAVAFEFAGKDGETQAKTWYENLAKGFPNHPYAARATGAARRLTVEGQPFALAGQTLDGQQFAMGQAAGKVVVVYYWASWGRDAANELKQLADLEKAHADKGLMVVTVNLDEEPAKAAQAINAAGLRGAHLYAPGGLEKSPLATAYGIQMVPHIFLIGKDGKVSEGNAQAGPAMKEQIEKLLK